MKDLQKAIEGYNPRRYGKQTQTNAKIVEMVHEALEDKNCINTYMSPKGTVHIMSDEKLTTLITSREQEIREEVAQEFLEWYAKDYPDGVWRDGAIIMREYLAQQKENK